MFSVRITSKWRGAATSFIAAESTSWCSSSTVGNSSRVHARDDLAPQPRGLEHVHLVHARHARARGREGDAGDALDLRACRTRRRRARRVALARLLAEVDAARELAHDEQVGALEDLALERAGVVERRQRAHRAQVGEQAEALAQRRAGPARGAAAPGSVESHFGPPTAASRTASARRQASSVASVSGMPWASIDGAAERVLLVGRTRRPRPARAAAAARISGPMPSPGSVTMCAMGGAASFPRRRTPRLRAPSAHRAKARGSATATARADHAARLVPILDRPAPPAAGERRRAADHQVK